MSRANSCIRRCYPTSILAAYIGDYREQILVALVKLGSCPICPAPQDKIRNWDSILEPHSTEEIINALNSIDKGATKFTKGCVDAGIKPFSVFFGKIYLLSISTPPSP